MLNLSIEEICDVLHKDCYGPWHPKDYYLYRATETHHPIEHTFMAQRIIDANNSKETITPCC